MTNYKYRTCAVRRDFGLIELLKESGWIVIGAGFKVEDTFTAKDTNKRLFEKVIPWETYLVIPCIEDLDMFWLAIQDNNRDN